MTLLAVLVLGFLLGMRHATDPDHVVAVTAFVTRQRTPRAALGVGLLWGLGHSATLFAVGGSIVLFGWVVTPRVGLSLEMCVALMLVLLGCIQLKAGSRASHVHPTRELRPLLVGMVHGLAGSAAIALLVLATIKSAALALVYLAVFGAGTLVGMAALTLSLSFPLAALAHRFHAAERHLGRVAGAASVAFGLFLAYQIGIAQGLLSDAPQWTPH